ncbi:B3 domain-containing protein [Zea mays]|uniref:B3 domain-containing protein n=1 Tax=Zea mays TaxID=4577 RepID=A0A3L6E8N4_MAIZE|nr:B3 domain-containing protein [Zea mays]
MEVRGSAPSMKPKVEPPLEASHDWEVTPLSGDNPFFTSVMRKSQVQNPFQLVIPVRFHRHLPEARAPAVLLCRDQSWTVSYAGVGKWKRLQGAWRDFARDNGLRLGDACVFELLVPSTDATQGDGDGSKDQGEVVFRVQVLRGGLPAEITSRGATSDDPLVIVD